MRYGNRVQVTEYTPPPYFEYDVELTLKERQFEINWEARGGNEPSVKELYAAAGEFIDSLHKDGKYVGRIDTGPWSVTVQYAEREDDVDPFQDEPLAAKTPDVADEGEAA